MTSGLPDYTRRITVVVLPATSDVKNPKKYEGSVAVVGTPDVLDVNADLDHNGTDGYIACDGSGDLEVDFSYDGTVFETDITIKNGEVFSLKGLNIDTIKVDATSNGTAYRVVVL